MCCLSHIDAAMFIAAVLAKDITLLETGMFGGRI